MAYSIRSAEFKEFIKRSKHAGATAALEAAADSGEFSDAASRALEKQAERARARNIRKGAIRTRFNFSRAIKRDMTRLACACGRSETETDHIIPIEAAGIVRASMLAEIAAILGKPTIADMTIQQFMVSRENAQPLCNYCNKKKAERFEVARKVKGFNLVEWLKSEKNIIADKKSNDDMREINSLFSADLAKIKRTIRKRDCNNPGFSEKRLTAYHYPEIKDFETRRNICLKLGVYMGKTEFNKNKKRLIEELAK